MTDPALQRLLDENAIRALVAQYSDAITHLDPVAAAATYAEDGSVSVVGMVTTGRAAIEAGMRETFAQFEALQLIAHGGILAVELPRAAARWSTLEIGVRKDSSDLHYILGQYDDELVKQGENWRFMGRTFSLAGRARVTPEKLQLNPAFFDRD